MVATGQPCLEATSAKHSMWDGENIHIPNPKMEVSKPKSSPNYPSGQCKGFCYTPCLRDLSDLSCTAIQDSSSENTPFLHPLQDGPLHPSLSPVSQAHQKLNPPPTWPEMVDAQTTTPASLVLRLLPPTPHLPEVTFVPLLTLFPRPNKVFLTPVLTASFCFNYPQQLQALVPNLIFLFLKSDHEPLEGKGHL